MERAHGNPPEEHIRDYDLVYFDGSDRSYEGEDSVIRRGTAMFEDLQVRVEIRNQARVHLWYQKHFGKPFVYLDRSGKTHGAYDSTEEAISSWPTTATSVGVRLEEGRFVVFAPFGTEDIPNMVVRPNKRGVPKEVYEEKAPRWASTWPRLKVLPWE